MIFLRLYFLRLIVCNKCKFFVMQNSIIISFLAICYVCYRIIQFSGELRGDNEKFGPFESYDYFCIATVVFFASFVLTSGLLVAHSHQEIRIIATLMQLLFILVGLSVILAKIFFKRTLTKPKKKKQQKASLQ